MPLRERAGEGEGGGRGEEWSRSPFLGTDRAAVFWAGLVIEYLVVPRRNFSSPLPPTPSRAPSSPLPIPSPPPHPVCLASFIILQENCTSNLQEEVGGGGRGGGHSGEEWTEIQGAVFSLSSTRSLEAANFFFST